MFNLIIKHSFKTFSNTKLAFPCTCSFSSAQRSTIDIQDVLRFNKLSKQWWDLEGEFKLLHTMNRLRIPLIRDRVKKMTDAPPHLPLNGLRLLDVGCGGGLLSEPLARLGANMVGLDASEENIQTAKFHQAQDNSLASLTYINNSLEDYKLEMEENGVEFDAVVLSEVVEHVNNLELFMDSACSLLKPGGSIFVTTINRTQISYFLAILLAEKVLSLVPDGIHDWNKFVKPIEIKQLLDQNDCSTRLVQGMCLEPLTSQWSWMHDQNVNYALHAIKNDAKN